MDERVNTALSWAATISWWLAYPLGIALWYIAISILFLLRLLYAPVAFLLQPVVYLSRFALACAVAPFAVAAKFETIYIYLGVAAVVGLLGGVCVRAVYAALRSVFRLDTKPTIKPQGRTVKQYRAQKQEQKGKGEEHAVKPSVPSRHLSPGALSPGSVSLSDSSGRRGRKPRTLLAQTIMEEDDSDF